MRCENAPKSDKSLARSLALAGARAAWSTDRPVTQAVTASADARGKATAQRCVLWLSWRGGAPFEPDGDAMLAQSGERVVLLGAARDILRQLRTTDDWSATKVAISSRTDEPAWAAELLDKFRVDDMVPRQCTPSTRSLLTG